MGKTVEMDSTAITGVADVKVDVTCQTPCRTKAMKKEVKVGCPLHKCPTFSKLRRQVGEMRRLTQPYFLSTEGASGYRFLWLLICLIFIVTGLTLLLIAGLMAIMQQAEPAFAEKIVADQSSFLGVMCNMWHTPAGGVIFGLCFLGVMSFLLHRKHLQGRRWLGWLLLGAVVFILLVINLLNTGIGFIARDLTNALVAKDAALTYQILMVYATCFILALPIRSLQYYFTSRLSILWREWLAKTFIDAYMGHRAYYDINPNDEANTEVDNPDQRIAEDTKTFTRESLSFTVGAFDALLTFVLNIVVLWTISQTLTYALFAYSGTATIVLILSSHKLVKINYNQLRYEADFRYGLVHIRNNAEAIAFYQGEEPEKKETKRRLGWVVTNFNYLIKWEVIISVLRRSYGYAGNFFPYLLMAPAYLRGEIEYGEFIQAKFAFAMVESALSFVVINIDQMAHWWAGISRLAGFQSSMQEINRLGAEREKEAAQREHDDLEAGTAADAILLHQVNVKAPASERLLVEDLTLSVGHGQRVLVVGPSGCGKTSVLRVASGLWQPEVGHVERPPVGKLLFVPQKPYMLLGSLREQLCYPLPQDSFDDATLQEALKMVQLGQLIDRYPDMTVKQDWPRLLSLGEQQRLAFARLVLNNPQFAVLDEATSALDVATEQRLYDILVQRGIAVVSVGHRPTLAAFHDQVLELSGQGRWRLLSAAGYEFNSA
eukprot:TRINITY_DN1977_c0_g1_i4.p1 TRINITY_DN1977_c0_g1~~TRINITY_DN1977_c0_g1_i4.p1  ORF type:complete len:716 (+),score=166.61 TRINITY_DN1977_c0_g1_i4:61-2208(+)